MSDLEGPSDPPGGWQRAHLQRYVDSDGAKGHKWQGVHTLLLTTRGRRTGRPRRTPLIYGRDGDDYLVVASNGGNREHPQWYRNLRADSQVRVQVEAEKFDAVARTADAEERHRLWPVMVKIWPAYDDYQTRTSREIPVVVLTPV